MPKCYVGSLNKAKLNAAKKVFKHYEVIGSAADSKVGCQPFSDEETIKGAYNRAVGLPRSNIRVGLEAGVERHEGKLFLVNWGVMVDENEKVYYAGGTRIPLPDYIADELLASKKELAAVIRYYSGIKNIDETKGAIGYLTASYVNREDIFVHILKILYGQYMQNKGRAR